VEKLKGEKEEAERKMDILLLETREPTFLSLALFFWGGVG